jgi:hypothetical protein
MRPYLFIIGLLISYIGNCCSCNHLDKIDDEQYNQYSLILKGKVIKITLSSFERIIFLKVNAYYKGEQNKDIIKIISPRQEGECGILPKVGEYWLMFANTSGNKFRTDLCTRTKNMNPKAWDYKKDELKSDLDFLITENTNINFGPG